jgi:hypothetical protein
MASGLATNMLTWSSLYVCLQFTRLESRQGPQCQLSAPAINVTKFTGTISYSATTELPDHLGHAGQRHALKLLETETCPP